MKNLFLVLLGITACFHQAEAKGIHCQVNTLYSIMDLRWDDQFVTIEVSNPKGFSAMPQLEAPVSESTIPLLQMQSKELVGLGDHFEYKWERKRCQFSEDDPWLVSCSGPSTSTGGDNGVKAALFTTAHIEEKSLSGKQSTLRLRFIFEKTGYYFVALPFPRQFCSQKEEKGSLVIVR